MLTTNLCRTLGIQHPIIQAGMAGEAGPELAAAVSNAGALGSIGSIGVPPHELKARIQRLRDLTDRPWAVNVVTFDSAPFSAESLDVAIAERVPVITLSFGTPVPALQRCKAAGIPAIVQVQDWPTAEDVLREGATAIIAQGNESGGHTGRRSTLNFGAQVLDAAGGTPVVLAGGIGNGRGLAAALAMGAQAVVMGTRFKASDEFAGSAEAKSAIVASDGGNTAAAAVFDAPYPISWPSNVVGRAMQSRFSAQWAGKEDELRAKAASMPPFALVMELAKDPATAINWAGESSGLVHEVLPAAEVVRRTVAEAEALLDRVTAALR